ncbi:MAG: hypothetical protein STHCBS139747_006766 [Sporothrix thermara]
MLPILQALETTWRLLSNDHVVGKIVLITGVSPAGLGAEAARYESVPDAAGQPIEKQSGTSHIGPFLLTNLLMPALLRGGRGKDGARIASVTSRGYLRSAVPRSRRPGDPPRRPGQPRRLRPLSSDRHAAYDAGTGHEAGRQGHHTALSVDPGTVGTTNLGRNVPLEEQTKLGWRLADGSLAAVDEGILDYAKKKKKKTLGAGQEVVGVERGARGREV